jgi:hypothetical protein
MIVQNTQNRAGNYSNPPIPTGPIKDAQEAIHFSIRRRLIAPLVKGNRDDRIKYSFPLGTTWEELVKQLVLQKM